MNPTSSKVCWLGESHVKSSFRFCFGVWCGAFQLSTDSRQAQVWKHLFLGDSKGNGDDMTTHTVTLQGSRLHKNSQQRLCGGLLLRALLLSFFVKWWTHHLDQQSAGSRVVRSPAAARVAPPLKPRWLKVGDAFRRLRLLPPPPCCFSISHTGSNCPKKRRMLP